MNDKVNRCICHDVSFVWLKRVAVSLGISTIDELKKRVKFGTGCHMCNPYVDLMLKTGKTSFDVRYFDLKRKGEDDE